MKLINLIYDHLFIRYICKRKSILEHGTHCKVSKDLIVDKSVKIYLGDQVVIKNRCQIKGDGSLYIGNGSSIGTNTIIFVRGKMMIGENVVIAPMCMLVDHDHSVLKSDLPMSKQNKDVIENITIGSDIWIGAHSVILKGVILEDGCVVGANSTVVTSFPKNSIIVGNKAKMVKSR